ncbi:MAG: response regulator with Che-like receiver domain [Bacteroidota bacterium]|nr:response regulator with Che-like receiver domain [Bacteroidota bacterium]
MILLADDDADDRFLFKEAVDETKDVVLVTVKDGMELMNKLTKANGELPDAIFLDLNMPFKNGHECLREIKDNEKLKSIPVIIYSTSTNKAQIDSTYKDGANLYIPKPDSFSLLKKIVEKVFMLEWKEYKPQPSKDKFVLSIQ